VISRIPCLAVLLKIQMCFSHLNNTVRSCFNSHIPCRVPAVPLCKQILKATAQHGRDTAWYVWINIGRLSTDCGRSAQVRFLPTTMRSFTIVNSQFYGYTRNFRKLFFTVRGWFRIGNIKLIGLQKFSQNLFCENFFIIWFIVRMNVNYGKRIIGSNQSQEKYRKCFL
jgi:hypothetical protein